MCAETASTAPELGGGPPRPWFGLTTSVAISRMVDVPLGLASDPPVRVERVGGDECIHYEAKRMEEGMPYQVVWYGQKVCLVKGKDEIRIVGADEV